LRYPVHELVDRTLQEPALALYQSLATLIEYPHPLRLPLHKSIIDAGNAVLVLRAPKNFGGIRGR